MISKSLEEYLKIYRLVVFLLFYKRKEFYKMKNNKGITLVALIITIIILLILAGVAISQLTDSGLFGKAKLARERAEDSQKLQNNVLYDYENKIDMYVNGDRETVTISTEEYEKLKNKGKMVLLASEEEKKTEEFTVQDLKQFSSFVFQVWDSSKLYLSITFSYDDLKLTENNAKTITLNDSTGLRGQLYYKTDTSVMIRHNDDGASKFYGIK